jgi:hypothetical protein
LARAQKRRSSCAAAALFGQEREIIDEAFAG